MKEYWEITRERGIATVAVWELDAGFSLCDLTLADHRTQVARLEEAARRRAQEQARVTAARNARDVLFDLLKEIIVRIPGVIEAMLEPWRELHSQLRLIYQVRGPFTQESALRRGRFVLGLWSRFNEELPAGRMPLVLPRTGGADLDVEAFEVLLTKRCLEAQQDLADAQQGLKTAGFELAALEKTLDLNNKRWFKAWSKKHVAGTTAGDAARAQIPTEQGGAAARKKAAVSS